jgi:hypothetical protein
MWNLKKVYSTEVENKMVVTTGWKRDGLGRC